MMPHAFKGNALVDELVTTITGYTAEYHVRRFKQCKDVASKALTNHHRSRVNPFEVTNVLDGLVEKFVILNNDPLADALRLRLDELSNVATKWTPEILSLFLHLSDRPAEESRLEDLAPLKSPEPPPRLTWAELSRDGPSVEKSLWANVDFAAGSSDGDESLRSEDSLEKAEDIRPPSVGDDGLATAAESCIGAVNLLVLEPLQTVQSWNVDTNMSELHARPKHHITELQVVRELLFMLSGLPTSLFRFDSASGSLEPREHFVLEHIEPPTLHRVLQACGSIGSKLNSLRLWTRKTHTTPLLQSFQAAVLECTNDFNRILSSVQQRFLEPAEAVTISLQGIYTEVEQLVQPLLQLSELVAQTSAPSEAHQFHHLELLYDRIGIAQMTGETLHFAYLANVFFKCLQAYLRPITRWMELGELGFDADFFFVSIAETQNDRESLWHDRYNLRHTPRGDLYAPQFIHVSAQMIFNTGKSVVFLKEFGTYTPETLAKAAQIPLDFQNVCGDQATMHLLPFSELFDRALDLWIRSKHRYSSSTLLRRLSNDCGLWRALDALEYIYLSRDGSLFQVFADSVNERIEKGKRGWNDRFLLTALAQHTLGKQQCVDADGIAVRDTLGETGDLEWMLQNVNVLAGVRVDYKLPWSIKNIVRQPSLLIHQDILTLLLQIHRVKKALQRLHKMYAFANKTYKHSRETERSFAVSYRLLRMTNIFHSHLTENVINTSTAEMRKKMAAADDVDAMASVHREFASRLERAVFLTPNLKPIYGAVISLLNLCLDFTHAWTEYEHTVLEATALPALDSHDQPASRPKPRRRCARRNSVSSSEDDEDSNERPPTSSNRGTHDVPIAKRLNDVQEQYDDLLSFLTAALRGMSRVGGEPTWEMLAERLEWDTGRR
ncbi:hypothetical protein LTR04_004048 [Oleoguttula sp. CCFEE 6159]|nr:hypothetical protein LTR04_004048 [Oleoguttula sp. CCFEE 6159]